MKTKMNRVEMTSKTEGMQRPQNIQPGIQTLSIATVQFLWVFEIF
jgi:hypothetical protein